MTGNTKLMIGYGRGTHPRDVRAVWGARLIWPNDLVADRQDLASHDEEARSDLIAWLNGPGGGDGAITEMRIALSTISGREARDIRHDMPFEEEAVVYEDDKGKIVGSAQGSFGYFYVCGWLKAHTQV